MTVLFKKKLSLSWLGRDVLKRESVYIIRLLQFWRRYWFSGDLDREVLFPIETKNMLSCLPDAVNKFPTAIEVWTRILAYW